MSDGIAATQRFYGRWARIYDRVATAPGVTSWRERVVETLERIITEAFDTLVETYESASLPNLRTAAYIVELSRVIGAYEAGGNWP